MYRAEPLEWRRRGEECARLGGAQSKFGRTCKCDCDADGSVLGGNASIEESEWAAWISKGMVRA